MSHKTRSNYKLSGSLTDKRFKRIFKKKGGDRDKRVKGSNCIVKTKK